MFPDRSNRLRTATTVAVVILAFLGMVGSVALSGSKQDAKEKSVMNEDSYNKLTPEEKAVIEDKGTESPFSGVFYKHSEEGTYVCKRCNAKLFLSDHKIDSECGWPSFDDAIKGSVKEVPDADGRRTEILCANCDGHLGHVFLGEQLTDKNLRHCVNSLSLNFAAMETFTEISSAYFAGGCFWGTEYYLQKEPGVISTAVGYMGGQTENPDYKSVCDGKTGHTETVEVNFDPALTSYEKLARLFFEIHDPTQVDGQGPDIGDQYRSAVFYTDDKQRLTIGKLIGLLKQNGYKVVTELLEADKFWPAEAYHQDYYDRTGHQPYCHFPKKKF